MNYIIIPFFFKFPSCIVIVSADVLFQKSFKILIALGAIHLCACHSVFWNFPLSLSPAFCKVVRWVKSVDINSNPIISYSSGKCFSLMSLFSIKVSHPRTFWFCVDFSFYSFSYYKHVAGKYFLEPGAVMFKISTPLYSRGPVKAPKELRLSLKFSDIFLLVL